MATATEDRTNGHVWRAPWPLPATLDLSTVTAQGATITNTQAATVGATSQVNATVTPYVERNNGADKAATVTAPQAATGSATVAATGGLSATRNNTTEAPSGPAATVTPAMGRTEKPVTAPAVADRNTTQGARRSGRSFGWLRTLLDALQANGVKVGYVMALAGSAVGQIAWWGSMFPIYVAAAFCFTYEAIMVGASKKATLRRMQGRSASALRFVSVGAAAAATWMNFTHMGSTDTVIRVFGIDLHGDPSLGIAFALMSAGGFLVHELATNADVNDRLRDTGQLKPIGLSRWIFHTRHSFRAKVLLLDRPDLSLAQAWEMTRDGDATDQLHTEALKAEQAAELVIAEAVTEEIPAVPADEPRKPASKPKAAKPRNASAEALAWVQSELAAGRTPSRNAIKSRFGLESASLRTYLSRWKSNGQITEAQFEGIK